VARLQSLQKDLQLAVAGIAPENIAAQLAAFARSELRNAIQDGEGSAIYEKYINGREGAEEESVVPPGPILYVFSWWDEIVKYALQYLVERSPEKSGRYKKAWQVMVNGQVVADPKTIPIQSVVTIINIEPYSRKIDVGHMRMSVPPFVVEDARVKVMSIFGNIITAKRIMITIPGGYVLKGRFRRGIRTHARRKLRPDTAAGAAMTYPALLLQMRNG
jgi:hypothetical protein